jgi:hypothetical protein
VRGTKTNIWTLVLAIAFALVVSGLDLLPRLERVPWYGFFVIPVIWVALWSAEDDILPLITVAVLVTSLAMLRSHVSIGIWAPAPVVDRLIVVSIIWFTVLLAILRKRARRTFKWITLAGRQWEPGNPGNLKNQNGQANQSNQKAKTNQPNQTNETNQTNQQPKQSN